MVRRSRRARLSAEEGRHALLEAGRKLAQERPAAPPLDHIRLTDVARHAGVSAGALYHYWDTQDDYRDDLVDHLFAPDRFEPDAHVGELAESVRGGSAAPPPLDEQIRVGAAIELDGLLANPDLRVLLALWAAGDADVQDRLAAHFRGAGRRWAEFYADAFRVAGIEVRPPFTYEMLAVLLGAIGDGLAVRASVDPAAVPLELDEQGEPGWGLLAASLVALLPAFSRPVGSDETFWDFLEQLRDDLAGGVSPDAR